MPIYDVAKLEHAGYIENGSFGTQIEYALHLAESAETQYSDTYDQEFQIYKESLDRNEADEIEYIEAVWAKLNSLQGFGYIMENTEESKDGLIECPASIAAWRWLADFASPQNHEAQFNNRAVNAVGIPWLLLVLFLLKI